MKETGWEDFYGVKGVAGFRLHAWRFGRYRAHACGLEPQAVLFVIAHRASMRAVLIGPRVG